MCLFQQIRDARDKFYTLAFVALIALVFLAHLATLSISPLPWIDEVQIIEMGRNGVLDQLPSWSMIVPDSGNCFWTAYYLGGLAQELAYRLTGSQFGPRLLSLIGLIFASLLLSIVLQKKNVQARHAFAIAAVFLVDPVITQNVRGARVDIWTIVCTLLSLLILSCIKDSTPKKDAFSFLAVGAISVVQLFIWASSVLQLPIIIVECWNLAEERKWRIGILIRWAVFGLLGGLLAMFLVAIPFLDQWKLVMTHFQGLSQHNLSQPFVVNVVSLLRVMVKTPFIVIAGMFSMVACKRHSRYLLCVLLILAFVLSTRIYIHRFVHIVPYFVLAFGLLVGNECLVPRFVKRCVVIWAVVALLYGGVYSVLIRNFVESFAKDARQKEIIVETMRDEVGGSGTRVYNDAFQLYYVGRSIGWMQYRMGWGEWWKPGNAEGILKKVDCFLGQDLAQDKVRMLEERGFRFEKTIELPANTGTVGEYIYARLKRQLCYGPFQLYRRKL
jgi:hypothetical protein